MIYSRLFCFLLSFFVSYCSANAQLEVNFLQEKAEINRFKAIQTYISNHAKDKKALAKAIEYIGKEGTEKDKLYFDFFLENSFGQLSQQMGLIDKYLIIAKNKENYFFISSLHHFKAMALRGNKQFALALENYLYAYDATAKDKNGDYFNSSFLFQQMGLAFLEFKDFDKALKFGLLAHQTKYFDDPNKNENWLPKANANLLGEAYRKLGKPDSALFWFKECFNLSQGKLLFDTLWQGISLGSIASIYVDKAEYSKALEYYLQGAEIHKGHDYHLIDYNINAFSSMAKVYLSLHNTKEAYYCLQKAASFLPKREFNNRPLEYYETLVDYYRQTNANPNVLLDAIDSLQHYHNIVDKEYNEKHKISIEASIAYNNQLLQTQKAEANFKKTRLTLFGAIAAIILLIVIGVLYRKRKNLRFKLKQQQLVNERQKANDALKLAQIQLQDFAKNIYDKNNLIEQFSNEVDSLKLQSNEQANEKVEIIDKLKQSVILTEADWHSYKVMFEKAYPQFAENIREQFAGITNAELRYLMLNKLNLDNKKMAATLGVSVEAVRNLKFRVKNKIGTDTVFFEG